MLPLGGILSVNETPEPLHGLENVTAYIHKMVSSEWAKYEFWVKYPFKVSRSATKI